MRENSIKLFFNYHLLRLVRYDLRRRNHRFKNRYKIVK